MFKKRAISTSSRMRNRKKKIINSKHFSFETFSSNRISSRRFRNFERPTRQSSSTTSIFSQKLTFKNESNKNYDILNLMLENNPNKCNYKKIKNKIKEINNLYFCDTRESYKIPKSTKRVEELYYNYNVLYGQNSSNLIKTYSPSMRPKSSSVNKFVKKMNMKQRESLYVFSDKEILGLIEAKCNDIGIEVKEHMLSKFKDYCNAKCKNRIVDLTENYLGINSVSFLGNILQNFDRISRINLSKNNLGDSGVEILINSIQNSISLISLNISSNDITSKGGEIIFKKMVNQQSLLDFNISTIEGSNKHRNRLTSIGIQDIVLYLKNNFIIEFLNLSGNSIKNEGFVLLCKGLNENKSLNSLKISQNEIGEKGIVQGLRFIKSIVGRLTILDISKNKIMNEGLITLTNKLKVFPNLYSLNISNCGFEFEGFKYLVKFLQYNRKIEILNVSGNKLRSKDFDLIKPYFGFLGLKSLNMSKCSLSDESTYELGECIEENCTIKRLNISGNEITDDGFRTFSKLFSKNLMMEYFDCSSNFLTDAGIKTLIKSLEINTSLKSLNLYDNQLHNEIGNLIMEVLQTNKTLVYINLYYNRIPIKKIDEINKILKLNENQQKLKLVPDLIKSVKDLEFNPEEFGLLTTKIKQKKREQNYLYQKVKDEDKMYSLKKNENQNQLKIKANEITIIKEKIKSIEKDIRSLEKQIELNEKEYVLTENNLKDKIFEEKRLLNESINLQKDAKIDYDNTYNEISQVLTMTQEKYNLSLRSLKKVENSLSLIKSEFEEKKKMYNDIMGINIHSNNIKKRKTYIYNPRSSLVNSRNSYTLNVTPLRHIKKNLFNIKGKNELYSIDEENKKNKQKVKHLSKNINKKGFKKYLSIKSNSVASLLFPDKIENDKKLIIKGK